jgi:hypothetical protein
MAPISASYTWTLCSKTSAPCSVFNAPVTGTNLTNSLSALVTAPRFTAVSGSFGYSDVEVKNPGVGSTYFNVLSSVYRVFNGTNWANGGSNSTPYIGLIATRAEISTQSVGGGTATWIMNRSKHVARAVIPANGIKVVWGNYYVTSSNVETGIGTATYKVAIEYPLGTILPCTFGGNTTISVVALADAITDYCGPAVPNGATFWVRALYTNPNGIMFNNYLSGHYSTTDEGVVFGTGTPNDLVNSGTVPTGVGSLAFQPYAIIGSTTRSAIALLGDSRCAAQADISTDFTSDVGEEARFIGPLFGYTKICVSSTNAGQITGVNAGNFTARLRLLTYASHKIDAFGINDLAIGTSASALAASRTQIASYGGNITFGTTLPSETSSTDNWATTGNQTITVNASAFNTLVRAGISGEVNYIDFENAVDPLGINKWPVSKIIGATTGTANFATADGIHENQFMNQIIAQILGYTANWFTR